MTQKKILVVDDDPHIREVICFALEKAGMSISVASNGKQATTSYFKSPSDLIVLDINMPEMDGLECCREIRKKSEVPILFLSSRDDEIDRILGLEIGGDDYVTKPFSPRELVARINAILKRVSKSMVSHDDTGEIIFSHGKLSMDIQQHAVWWDSQSISLTATEFAMLTQMLKQPKRVFSRDLIMDRAYQNNVYVSDRTIDSHIRHIRQKFSAAGCYSVIETQLYFFRFYENVLVRKTEVELISQSAVFAAVYRELIGQGDVEKNGIYTPVLPQLDLSNQPVFPNPQLEPQSS